MVADPFRYEEFLNFIRAEAIRIGLDDEDYAAFMGGGSSAYHASVSGHPLPSDPSSWWDIGIVYWKAHMLEIMVEAASEVVAAASAADLADSPVGRLHGVLDVAERADIL